MKNRREFLSSSAAALALPPANSALAQEQLLERLKHPSGKVQVVVDSDTYNEIDDQFAVAYALRSPEKMEVEAIHAAPFLNARSKSAADGMQQSYQEILRILKVLGRGADGFAYRGSEQFLAAPGKPVASDAARDLVRRAMAGRQGLLYVLTVGAPTNVSSAILMEPRIKEKIVVVWLGGQPYNWPTAREFNLYQDIHASRILYDSGVPLVNIPTKNVSEHLRTTLPEVERFLKGRSRLADYLFEQFHAFYVERRPAAGYPWSKVIWDISAVAWLVNPKWVPTEVVPSPRLTDQFTWEAGAGRHPVRVATNVLRDQVFNDLFAKLAR